MKLDANSKLDPFIAVEGPGARVLLANPKTPVEPLVEGSEDSFEPLVIDNVIFPRVVSQRIRAMSTEERAVWESERLRCKTDQLYLSDVLGMDLQENPHRALFAQFLKKKPGVDLSQLDAVIKKRMILWPRGVAKTTSSRVEMVQLILNYPNIRICFLTGGDELAKRQLAALKTVFEKPKPAFLQLFPEFCLTSTQNKKTKRWQDVQDELGNAHEFIVPCRTNTVFAEPTFAISTARSVKSGLHFDVIFIDDLVNDQNYRSVKMLDKCYEDYLAICPLLEPAGFMIVTGTRYSYGDTYERIQEQANEAGEATIWRFSIRDCWSTGCKNCKHADVFHDRSVNIVEPPCTAANCQCKGFVSDGDRGVLFPQVKTRDGRTIGHTVEFLEKTKSELGPSFFATQYLNSPLSADTQIFTETMIGAQTLHDRPQILGLSPAVVFCVGDLADSEQADRDLSVIYACIKSQGQIFVYDCVFGHWNSHQLVESVIRVLMEHRPQVMYLEKTLGSDGTNNLILARAAQLNMPKVPVEWLKPGNQKGAKAARINNIQAGLLNKRLFLYSGMPGYQKLVDQLVKFPRVKHDDFADALGWVIAAPTGYEFDQPPQRETMINWLHRLHACDPPDDNYPDTGGGSGLACGG